MSDVLRPRRFYLMSRIEAARNGELALRDVWHSKQDTEPGQSLPDAFPAKAQLATAGYTTVEDIDGADAEELADYVGVSQLQSEAIFAALAEL